MAKALVNAITTSEETGEILSYGQPVVILEEGDCIITKNQREHTATRVVINKDEGFVKLYDKAVIKLNEIFHGERPFVIAMLLPPYVDYRGILVVNGNTANITNLATALSVSRPRLSDSVDKLIQHGVLAKVTVGHITGDPKLLKNCYVVNPYIYCRGKDVLKTLVNVFDNSGWANL